MAKALGESSSCNVCHVGANKKKRNDYGAAFQKVLKKNGGQPAIVEALDKVAKQHSKPKDDKSPTFGELIEEGKLPDHRNKRVIPTYPPMPKRKSAAAQNIIPHPRYGRVVPSGYNVSEKEIRTFRKYEEKQFFPESAIPAVSRQNYSVFPRRYYVVILKHCRGCSQPFPVLCPRAAALVRGAWFHNRCRLRLLPSSAASPSVAPPHVQTLLREHRTERPR